MTEFFAWAFRRGLDLSGPPRMGRNHENRSRRHRTGRGHPGGGGHRCAVASRTGGRADRVARHAGKVVARAARGPEAIPRSRAGSARPPAPRQSHRVLLDRGSGAGSRRGRRRRSREDRASSSPIPPVASSTAVAFSRASSSRGQKSASPALFPETVFNSPASHVASVLGLNGAAYALVGDETAWVAALQTASVWLRQERVEQVLVMGAEEFDPVVLDAYRSARWLRRQNGATGFLTSEGAGRTLVRRADRMMPRELSPPAMDLSIARKSKPGSPQKSCSLPKIPLPFTKPRNAIGSARWKPQPPLTAPAA